MLEIPWRVTIYSQLIPWSHLKPPITNLAYKTIYLTFHCYSPTTVLPGTTVTVVLTAKSRKHWMVLLSIKISRSPFIVVLAFENDIWFHLSILNEKKFHCFSISYAVSATYPMLIISCWFPGHSRLLCVLCNHGREWIYSCHAIWPEKTMG